MFARLTKRDVIAIEGDDAATFLQGQLTQDVEAISLGGSAWSLALAPDGKLCAYFRLHRKGENSFLIDLETGWAQHLVDRLERFRLRTKVTFNILSGYEMLSIGNNALSSNISIPPIESEISTKFKWPSYIGRDFIDRKLVVPEDLGVDGQVFEHVRISMGMPRLGRELTEKTIPAEGGTHFITSTVSFDKGCFVGQELVARIHSRGGNVPRPIRLLRLSQPTSAGVAVTFQGEIVGIVTSSSGDVALATIMRKVPRGGKVLVGANTALVGTIA